MKVALCLFFNYPYPSNIPVLDALYRDWFDEVVYLQPFVESSRPDVQTVYRAAFNFGGYFADSRAFLEGLGADYYVFAGDDCLLNRHLFSEGFERTFLGQGDFAAMIPQPLQFCNGNEWNNFHKINSLARLVKGYGLFDQRVEGWERFLPPADSVSAKAGELGVAPARIRRPDAEREPKLTPSQREVMLRLMGDRDEIDMPYPLVYAVSDFFIVSGGHLPGFCAAAGAYAALNLFSEVAVPTAICALDGPVLTAKGLGLNFDWTWGRNPDGDHAVPESFDAVNALIEDMGPTTLFRHPVKLSRVTPSLQA